MHTLPEPKKQSILDELKAFQVELEAAFNWAETDIESEMLKTFGRVGNCKLDPDQPNNEQQSTQREPQ